MRRHRFQEELRTVLDLPAYDPGVVGQIVERIVVYEGGRLELVMRGRDVYERMFRGEAEFEMLGA